MANSAPGKHYRKGLSLVQLLKLFPDDAVAEKWFEKKRWGGKPFCPHCGTENVQSNCKHKTMPYRCREKECGKRFSVKVKSVMESSAIGYQKWAMAIYLLTTGIKGVSSLKLHRDLDVTQKTAWFMAHRLREAFENGGPFSGPVEVDETYIGGKRKNMSNKKRKALKDTGRGGTGKAIVVGARDRGTKRVSATRISNADSKTLHDFIHRNVDADSIVYTDDHRGYTGLPHQHKTVKHSVSQYVNDQAHTNGIESFWALLKRGYHGTYHHMSEKHLDRYVGEFSGRYNQREMDTIEQMEAIAGGIAQKRLKYIDLIA